jgi:hypothetical protein
MIRSAQELFDTSVNALRKQGKKSTYSDNSGSVCQYRAPDGCKCAIGHLIPDDEYMPIMEGMDVHGIFRFLNDKRKMEFVNNENLLYTLQNIHDNYNVAEWEAQWKWVATRLYSLNYKEV